uniref:Uncharacterized protein n=1 Tax=Solanum tuberosum TaxID=4113 RepID=M1DR05_SOLTU
MTYDLDRRTVVWLTAHPGSPSFGVKKLNLGPWTTYCGLIDGVWIEEKNKDTNRQKGTKQTEEVKKGEPEDRQEHLACCRVATLTA